jgi:hypothetical protein
MIITTVATVQYACYLTEEEAEKVRAKAEKLDGDMITAVWDLYGNGEINLYRKSTECDFSTEAIIEIEED